MDRRGEIDAPAGVEEVTQVRAEVARLEVVEARGCVVTERIVVEAGLREPEIGLVGVDLRVAELELEALLALTARAQESFSIGSASVKPVSPRSVKLGAPSMRSKPLLCRANPSSREAKVPRLVSIVLPR